ncbi:MAG: shikimate dehydrogenase, partial [Comamonas sp.]
MPSSIPSTDLYCVFGNPVAHSRSPWIHARFAQLTQQPIVYARRLVPLSGFTQDLQCLIDQGGRGCNITVPFKLDAAQAAHSRSPRVELAGAANTLVIDA